ncbi:MAG: 1-acyl-sn-glycerol-3-phosphate acyltransferase [Burkholderiales bacterium]|nr:1-acyl-sn-glycerol-3-phosphate acyltransferase [Burkholderiales bacterium]
MKTLLRWWLRWALRVRVLGDPAPLQDRRVLIVANHASRWDSLLLALCLPVQPLVVFPREDKRGPLMRLACRFIDHQMWDMNHPLTAKKVLRVVEQGRPVVLFPEGRVVRAGNVMKVYEVPALIAMKSGATVVPVHVEIRGGRFGARAGLGPVCLRIQPAARIDAPEGSGARDRRAHGALELSKILQTAVFHGQPAQGLFDSFLDACEREGRDTAILEDMQEEPKTYGDLLKASLAIGRWVRRHTEAGETVGVLMPNVFVSVGVLLALQ